MPLAVVSRHQWRGDKHPRQYYPVVTPALYVFLGSSLTQPCYSLEGCRRQLSLLQMRMGRKTIRSDIVYNFLVSSEGVVYEARGWNSRACYPSRFEKPFTPVSYYVGFIGDLTSEPPTIKMREALHEFLQYGVRNHYINKRFTLLTVNITVDRVMKAAKRKMDYFELY